MGGTLVGMHSVLLEGESFARRLGLEGSVHFTMRDNLSGVY